MRSGQFPLGPFVRIPVRRVQIPPPPPPTASTAKMTEGKKVPTKTAKAPAGGEKKRKKARMETYSLYIYRGVCFFVKFFFCGRSLMCGCYDWARCSTEARSRSHRYLQQSNGRPQFLRQPNLRVHRVRSIQYILTIS